MSNILLLTMGGIGARFGSEIPKQFTLVNNQPIFMYILEAYMESEIVDKYVLITNPGWIDLTNFYLTNFRSKSNLHIVPGGKSRSESIKNAITFLKGTADSSDRILIHDSTHPYFDKNAIIQGINALDQYDGSTVCQREYDTCYYIENDEIVREIPKSNVVSGASPEIFRYGDLQNIYEKTNEDELESMTSAGALALSNGLKMKVISSPLLNLKITKPRDMDLFRKLCSTYYFEKG